MPFPIQTASLSDAQFSNVDSVVSHYPVRSSHSRGKGDCDRAGAIGITCAHCQAHCWTISGLEYGNLPSNETKTGQCVVWMLCSGSHTPFPCSLLWEPVPWNSLQGTHTHTHTYTHTHTHTYICAIYKQLATPCRLWLLTVH